MEHFKEFYNTKFTDINRRIEVSKITMIQKMRKINKKSLNKLNNTFNNY